MPTFLMLSVLGPDGSATLRENPKRIKEVNGEVEAMGASVLAQYALLGQWDFMTIIEAPDTVTMSRIATTLAARGTLEDHDAHGDTGRRVHRSARRRSRRTAGLVPPGAALLLLAHVVVLEQKREVRRRPTDGVRGSPPVRRRPPRSRGPNRRRDVFAVRRECPQAGTDPGC